MPWQLQPLIWPIIIATLALLSVPHKAHPGTPAAEPSAAVKAACTADVKRLCPKEYANRHPDGGAAIGACMKAHAFSISGRCIKAWLFEHPEDKR
jgi:hypothetical protein